MKISVFIFSCFKAYIYCSISTNEYYDIQQNLIVNETIGQVYHTESLSISSFLTCLSLCNSIPSCLTTVYQKNTRICSLYSKPFQGTDLAILMGSNVYIKVNTNVSFSSTTMSSVTTITPSNLTVASDQSTNTLLTVTTETTTEKQQKQVQQLKQ